MDENLESRDIGKLLHLIKDLDLTHLKIESIQEILQENASDPEITKDIEMVEESGKENKITNKEVE